MSSATRCTLCTMPETHVVSARAAHAWVSRRLPIMEGLRALGLRDRQIARALGIGRVAISAWADGSKPIPPLRHAQLIWLLGVLIGRFGKLQVNSRYALVEARMRRGARMA